MKEFNDLCREFEEMDVESYNEILGELSARIIPALQYITAESEQIFARFLMGAVVSDGKLSEEEYAFMEPALRRFFGTGIDYDYCKALVKENKTMSKELKSDVDYMVDFLGLLSDDLKNDIITTCLMVCAIDGKVSLKEKRWIKQLIKE
ncbi:MAG: TerB family tellurite resistance protein [Clostridia bacterium]|nr:TerB family tellurite resistance protein [Clostridia bacterium]